MYIIRDIRRLIMYANRFEKDTRREEAKKLIEADLMAYGCLSITLSRMLVRKKGFSFPSVARMTEDVKRELISEVTE
jgi:hypothetical protein